MCVCVRVLQIAKMGMFRRLINWDSFKLKKKSPLNSFINNMLYANDELSFIIINY